VGLAAVARLHAPAADGAPLAPESAQPFPARIITWAGMLAVSLSLAAAAGRAILRGADTNWDVWAFWLPKARAIYYFGGLDSGPAGITSYAHPEYPPLLPIQNALLFGFQGNASAIMLPLQNVVIAAAFFLALAAMLRSRVAGYILWPSLALLASASSLTRYFDSALADPTMAFTLALAGTSAALWWLERHARWRNLTGLLLAVATLQKSEGLLLALLLGALLVILACLERRQRREALSLAAVPLLAILPWRVWLARLAEPLPPPNYNWRDLFDPGLLVDRSDRLTYAVGEMLSLIIAPQAWLLIVPAALVVAAIAAPAQPALAGLVLGWLGLSFLGLATVYWIGSPPVDWYVDTSAKRVLLSLGAFAGALLPLLTAEALSSRQRQPPVSPL